MLDFTSALYLGFTHPSVSLAPWRALTLGRPAALEEPPGAGALASDLGRLVGADAGLVYPSTLHLFRDLFGAIAGKGTALLIDAEAYPIARWGTERAQLLGTALETYPHHDAAALAKQARRVYRRGLRPIVVTDGLCPACGRLAPLPELARTAAQYGGELVVDDTQALGILGEPGAKTTPLGRGGGGTLAWYGLRGPHVCSGSSLAKGFGAPLAVLLGGKDTVGKIALQGETRIHTSPPSIAAIVAARHALTTNVTEGDLLRARLARRVAQLRQGLVRIGARLLSFLPLPVQRIALRSDQVARSVLAALEARGIRVLATKACSGELGLSIILTTRHAAAQVACLIDGLAQVLRGDALGNRIGRAIS